MIFIMPCIKIELKDITKIEHKVVGSADKGHKEREKVDRVKERKDVSPKIAEVGSKSKKVNQIEQRRQVEQLKQLDTKTKTGGTGDTDIIKKVNQKEVCHALILVLFAIVGVLLTKFLIKK